MSGFIAICHRSGQPVDPQLLEGLTERLARRGPDGWNTWCSGPIGLGRSLLRTTREIEPVPGPIAFDGIHLAGDVRLDDREGLARRLRAEGWQPDSPAADIEMLLHAWRFWGEKSLDIMAGDFSFVLWDARQNRLVAARDHFGIVPLYYAEAGEALLVSNSLSCILAHPDVDVSLSEEAVADYLAAGMRTTRTGTCYKGIKRLEPGHILHAAPDDLRISAYWKETEDRPDIRYRRPADYVERFRELFDAAVRDRVRCDRVATHLSGGMDASSIAVTIARQYGPAAAESMRAYTYYFRDLIPDEEHELSKTIAARSGIPLELIEIESFLDRVEGMVPRYVAPEPAIITDSSPASGINVRSAAHARVIFMGFGGDPLFGPMGKRALVSLLHPRFPRDLLFCYRTHGRLFRPGIRSAPVLPAPATDRLLNADFAAAWNVDGRRRQWRITSSVPQRRGMALNPLWTAIFDSTDPDFTGLPLKARFPFFDLRLFRYLNSIPAHPWTGGKMLLRLAMSGSLPEQIRTRPKRGLQGNPWLIRLRRNGPQPWMFDLLDLDALQPYLNRNAARKMLLNPEDWDASTFSRFRSLFSFGLWLRDRPSRAANRPAGYLAAIDFECSPVYNQG